MQVGDAVKYRNRDGIVVGMDENSQTATIAFVDEKRVAQLGGAEWRLALDRDWSVPFAEIEAVRPQSSIDSRDEVIRSLGAEAHRLNEELSKTTEHRDKLLQESADANAVKKPVIVPKANDQQPK